MCVYSVGRVVYVWAWYRVAGLHGIKLTVILYTVHYPQRYVTFVKSSRVGHIVSFFQNVNTNKV